MNLSGWEAGGRRGLEYVLVVSMLAVVMVFLE
jgi:hypothetical protein